MLGFWSWLGDEPTHSAKTCCVLPVDYLYLVLWEWRLDVCCEIWLQLSLVRTMDIWGSHKHYSFSQMEGEYIPLFRLVAVCCYWIVQSLRMCFPKPLATVVPFQVAQEVCNKLSRGNSAVHVGDTATKGVVRCEGIDFRLCQKIRSFDRPKSFYRACSRCSMGLTLN